MQSGQRLPMLYALSKIRPYLQPVILLFGEATTPGIREPGKPRLLRNRPAKVFPGSLRSRARQSLPEAQTGCKQNRSSGARAAHAPLFLKQCLNLSRHTPNMGYSVKPCQKKKLRPAYAGLIIDRFFDLSIICSRTTPTIVPSSIVNLSDKGASQKTFSIIELTMLVGFTCTFYQDFLN
jgi:hypothetical protein